MNTERLNQDEQLRNTSGENPLENMPSFEEHMQNMEKAPKLTGEDGKTLAGISKKLGFDKLDDILSHSIRLEEVQETVTESLGDAFEGLRKCAGDDPKAIVVCKEVCEHVKKLGKDGKIGADVAKVWLNPSLLLPPIGTSAAAKIYDAVEERQGDRMSEEQQTTINETLLKMAKRYPKEDIEVQGNFGLSPVIDEDSILKQKVGFIHFNDRKQGSGVDMRCYITLNPDKKDQALKAWYESVAQSGAKDSLYYKVGIQDEHIDDIVIYRSDAVADDALKKALELFSERSAADGLVADDETIPTGRKIAAGIAIAPETKYANKYLKATEARKYSYNQFIARMMELSACIATTRMENGQIRYAKDYDGVRTGKMHSTKNRDFRREMRGAFREFMMLAKINPDTMLPVEYGDSLPKWAQLEK